MEYYIYLDVFFLLNFICNLLLLFCARQIGGEQIRLVRLIPAALAGALSAAVMLFFSLPAAVFSLAAAGMMAGIFFGRGSFSQFIKRSILLYFMAFCLNGAVEWAGPVRGASLFLIFSLFIGRERKRQKNQIKVILSFRGKTVHLNGFLDTGNQLTEPLTGKPVHIVSYEAVKTILPGQYQQAAEYYFRTGILESTKVSELQMYEFTFLSYHSIGNESGQLLGIRMDSAVYISSAGKKTEEKAVVGLADQKIFLDGRCQMIMNGRLEL